MVMENSASKNLRVLHVITSLGTGGAEAMLFKLLSCMKSGSFDNAVAVLMDDSAYGARIRELGVPVYPLGMRRGRPGIGSLLHLRRIVANYEPDLVQGWMYHGNIAAQLAVSFTRNARRVLWNIRHSLNGLREEKALTRFLIRLGAILSSRPARIVYNSEMSAGQHEALGYRGANRVVLGNGFDTERFVFSNEGRQRVRDELGLQSKNFLVGTIARFHRIKDFPNLIQSAALNRDRSDDLRYLLVGPGVDWSQPSLANSIQVANLKTMIHLIGERHDIPSVLSAFDLFVLSSSGEGFPNVIGEAMACERPCVVTNVGDSAAVVGQHGIIVPPKDPKALADAILKMATMSADERKELGRKARQRVIDNYSLPKIVEQYESLYRSVINEFSAA